jgi:uncharacterized protein YggE
MEKSVKITLIISATIIFVALIAVYTTFQLIPTSNAINVNGQATVKVVPDLVTTYFSVQTKAATAKEAKDKNSEITNNLTNNLISKGFAKEDIQTQSFSVYPDYTWKNGQQSQNGYIATRSIIIQLSTEEMDKLGDVIDAGIDSGASLSYINFELQKSTENTYKAEALKLATNDAKIKAESIAEGLGKKVGRIVSVSDSSFNYYPWPVYKAEAGSSASDARTATMDIQPSEQEINAQVSVSYKLN